MFVPSRARVGPDSGVGRGRLRVRPLPGDSSQRRGPHRPRVGRLPLRHPAGSDGRGTDDVVAVVEPEDSLFVLSDVVEADVERRVLRDATTPLVRGARDATHCGVLLDRRRLRAGGRSFVEMRAPPVRVQYPSRFTSPNVVYVVMPAEWGSSYVGASSSNQANTRSPWMGSSSTYWAGW